MKKLNISYETVKANNNNDEESNKDNLANSIDNDSNNMSNNPEFTGINPKKNINSVFEEIIEKNFVSKLKENRKNENNLGQTQLLVVGLGSGSTVSLLVEKFATFQEEDKERLGFIPTSYQIKLVGEQSGLKFLDESKIIDIDLVIDGADQIDSKLNMIKGGGGALFKEKILMQSAKKKIIIADSQKYVSSFTIPVPVEVHPFARSAVSKKIGDLGGNPKIRFLKKGYPFITENGNMILDTQFAKLKKEEIPSLEGKIKNISGVIEVGLFSSTENSTYYSLKDDGTFSKQMC